MTKPKLNSPKSCKVCHQSLVVPKFYDKANPLLYSSCSLRSLYSQTSILRGGRGYQILKNFPRIKEVCVVKRSIEFWHLHSRIADWDCRSHRIHSSYASEGTPAVLLMLKWEGERPEGYETFYRSRTKLTTLINTSILNSSVLSLIWLSSFWFRRISHGQMCSEFDV